MSTNTLRLNGTVIVEGVAFGWFVTNGESQQLMGRHCTLGTQIGQLTESPESQAHVVGATMLRDAARTAGVGYIDAADELPMCNGHLESTFF
jgi:hypothetical protein